MVFMTIKDLKNNRNKLMTDAQALLLKDKVTVEDRTSANAMLADANLLDADIANLEKVDKTVVEERASTMPNRPGIEQSTNDPWINDPKKTEKRAFERYVRYGIVDNTVLRHAGMSPEEYRDITTGGNNSTLSAAFTVPQAFYPVLTEAKKSYGEILNVIKMLDVDNGAPTKYATVSDVANTLSIVGEAQSVSEVDPTQITGAIISSDFTSTGIIKVSLAELQDSAFDLDAWIKTAFGIRYYRGLSSWVTNGNTSNVASLKTSAVSGATSAYTNQIVYADVAAVYAALDPAYRQGAVWSFNTNTQGLLLSQCDNIGRPLFIPAPSAEAFDTLLGHRVVLNQFLDNVTAGQAKIALMYGDHSAYLLRTVKPGLSVMRLNERFIDTGEIGFVGFARVGGALLQSTIPPVISLTMATTGTWSQGSLT